MPNILKEYLKNPTQKMWFWFGRSLMHAPVPFRMHLIMLKDKDGGTENKSH